MGIRFDGNWFEAAAQALRGRVDAIKRETRARAYEVANELRNSELEVLRGQRSGRRYRVPFTHRYYTASAPGEPPAVRTGMLRQQWKRQVVEEPRGNGTVLLPQITSAITLKDGKPLAELLDEGSPGGRLKPRPFKERVLQRTMSAAIRILKRPYTT